MLPLLCWHHRCLMQTLNVPMQFLHSSPHPTSVAQQGLNLLADLNGKTYADLSATGRISRYSFDSRAISFTKFTKSTSEAAVLRVYEDLNCGAENLNKQQVGGWVGGEKLGRHRAAGSGPVTGRQRWEQQAAMRGCSYVRQRWQWAV